MNFAPLHNLARRIAPEIPRLYVLAANELDLPKRAGCLGWATNFCISIRESLVNAGKWQGQAPMIVLDVERIDDEAAEFGFHRELYLAHTFVHELGHIVPYVEIPELTQEPSTAILDWQRAAYAASNVRRSLPWYGHDDKFTRRTLHLWWRAVQAGCNIPLGGLCCGFSYRLSHPAIYLEALGNECEHMAAATFTEIESTAPPKAFAEIFQSDKAFYFHFQTDPQQRPNNANASTPRRDQKKSILPACNRRGKRTHGGPSRGSQKAGRT